VAKRRRDRTEESLDAIRALRDRPYDEVARSVLVKALTDRSGHVVAAAAKAAAELEAQDLGDELTGSLARLLSAKDPVKSDPACTAKTKLAQTLVDFGQGAETEFLTGVKFRQFEPVWGGSEDRAFHLRGACAHGLVQLRYPGVLHVLADLLADPESRARSGAAQALAYYNQFEGASLLRLKLHTGDAVTEVMADCMAAYLAIEEAAGVPFIASFLDQRDEALQEAAALALGEARLEGAFEVIHSWWERTRLKSVRAIGLTAIAILRSEASQEFLLDLVQSAPQADALQALAGLEIYAHDPSLAERVLSAAASRSPEVRDRAKLMFDS
jgi:hypothetical protein